MSQGTHTVALRVTLLELQKLVEYKDRHKFPNMTETLRALITTALRIEAAND